MLDGTESMRERSRQRIMLRFRGLVENSGRSQEHVRYVELRQFTRSLSFSLSLFPYLSRMLMDRVRRMGDRDNRIARTFGRPPG